MAVIGAGHVGCALAGDLALRGVDVRLYNRSPQRLDAIETAGGISLRGEVEGFAVPGLVTRSLADAVSGAAVVAVTVPTASLPHYASALLEATTPAQLIWLDPGHSGGALYLAERARASGHDERTICQLTTASHVSRLTGPATVQVFLRPRSSVAALPAREVDGCHQRLDALLPGSFGRAESILEADLANINAVLHPPGMVCNAGWIEATAGDFEFYAAGNGRAVARVVDGIDRERLALAHSLRVPAVPFPELFHQLGFTPCDQSQAVGAYDAIRYSELIRPLRSPPTLDHRYLHEDVGWGLVPWLHLAAAAHSPAPTIASVVHLAGAINGLDYARDGLTLTAMGLAGKTPDEIRAQVGARTPGRADAHAGPRDPHPRPQWLPPGGDTSDVGSDPDRRRSPHR